MITLAGIFLSIVGLSLLIRGICELTSAGRYGMSVHKSGQYSYVSRALIRQWKALPEDLRIRFSELPEVVKALDVKYPNADPHFSTYDSSFNWRHGCYDSCALPEYRRLHTEMTRMVEAVAERDRQLRLSSMAHSLEGIEALTQSMRDETELIHNVTRELA